MGDADRGRPPLHLYSELHIPSVLIDGAVRACSVENDRGVADVPRFQACEAAVAGDLVLQHELEYQVPLEPQLLLDDDAHQTEADGDAGFVIHRAAAEDRIGLGVDMSGERWMGPFRRIPRGLNIEMAVENKRAAATSSRQANDHVVAPRDRADWLDGIGMAAQRAGVHRYQGRSQSDRGHMLANTAHDGVLGLEATRNADQFLQQGGPILLAPVDHGMRAADRSIDCARIARACLEPGATIVRAAHSTEPLEHRRTEHDYFLVHKRRLGQTIDAPLAASSFKTEAPSPGDPVAGNVAAALADRLQSYFL